MFTEEEKFGAKIFGKCQMFECCYVGEEKEQWKHHFWSLFCGLTFVWQVDHSSAFFPAYFEGGRP
jgi:hypothetical protein